MMVKDAGLIILDISDVGRPKLISHLNWCPRPQTNDVHVDADGLIYITDRVHGGLDVVEYTGPRPSSRTQAAEPAYA
jgi:hypothetical protein